MRVGPPWWDYGPCRKPERDQSLFLSSPCPSPSFSPSVSFSLSALPLPAMWGHNKKVAVCKAGRGLWPRTKWARTLILDFLASKSMGNKSLVLKLPVYGACVTAAPADEQSIMKGMCQVLWGHIKGRLNLVLVRTWEKTLQLTQVECRELGQA